jgi:hypothetical protein
MKVVTNVVNESKNGKKPRNQSVRTCIYCLEENPHTKSCHVIARSIELMRFGIKDRHGGMIRQSIDGNLGLKETRIDRGKFWCDVCEEKIGGIDDQLVIIVKYLAHLILEFGESADIQVLDESVNQILIKGIKSIFIRDCLHKRKIIPVELDLLNDLKIRGIKTPKLGVLCSTILRINPSNRIVWFDEYPIGLVEFNFGREYSMVFQLGIKKEVL